MSSRISSFLAELKRRKVYTVAVAYCAIAAGIIGTASQGFPELWQKASVPAGILLLIGFPIAVVLAWAYEVRPDKPEGNRSVATLPVAIADADSRKSIVVLPFDNMSPDAGDAHFSDGLTEEIITHLSYLRSLRVISRSSAMVLKGTQKDVRTIGKELDVQYVLEGSVRKAGNDLRITAQLVDAGTDTHMWAERYDGVLDDVFEIQETVSQSIVKALNLTLTSKEHQKLAERPIHEVQAYECYLRARIDIHKGTAESLASALHRLEAFWPNRTRSSSI